MTPRIDELVSERLSAAFGHSSRRSFLHRLSRAVFALAGVHLAATAPAAVDDTEVRPPAPPAGGKPDPWEWCGLHGYLCQGNCNPQGAGNMGKLGDPARTDYAWVACCKNPGGKWRCITYADYCGTRGSSWGTGCPGKTPSGATWCGGASGSYICTDIQIGATDHDTASACTSACRTAKRPYPC